MSFVPSGISVALRAGIEAPDTDKCRQPLHRGAVWPETGSRVSKGQTL
jgi:hypothetical protein